MSNIMVSNIMVNAAPGIQPDPKAQVDPGNEDNFSNYLTKKVNSERRERSSLVGVKNQSRPKDDSQEPEVKKDDSANDEISAEAFLQQLLADLRDLVEKPGTQAGQWNFQLKSMGLLNQLAQQVGMNPADLAQLKKQMDTSGTKPGGPIYRLWQVFSGPAAAKRGVGPGNRPADVGVAAQPDGSGYRYVVKACGTECQ